MTAKILNLNLFSFLAFLSIYCIPTTASANMGQFVCGNQVMSLELDPQSSTFSGFFMHGEPISWTYDGHWLSWRVARTGAEFRIHTETGVFVDPDGRQVSNCYFSNPAALLNIATSKGLALRDVYISLPESDRITIQEHLASRGLYTSGVDGIYGPGTEGALLAYWERYAPADMSQYSLNSETEALSYFNYILSEFGHDPIDTHSSAPFVLQNINLRDNFQTPRVGPGSYSFGDFEIGLVASPDELCRRFSHNIFLVDYDDLLLTRSLEPSQLIELLSSDGESSSAMRNLGVKGGLIAEYLFLNFGYEDVSFGDYALIPTVDTLTVLSENIQECLADIKRESPSVATNILNFLFFDSLNPDHFSLTPRIVSDFRLSAHHNDAFGDNCLYNIKECIVGRQNYGGYGWRLSRFHQPNNAATIIWISLQTYQTQEGGDNNLWIRAIFNAILTLHIERMQELAMQCQSSTIAWAAPSWSFQRIDCDRFVPSDSRTSASADVLHRVPSVVDGSLSRYGEFMIQSLFAEAMFNYQAEGLAIQYQRIGDSMGVRDILRTSLTSSLRAVAVLRDEFPDWPVDDLLAELNTISRNQTLSNLLSGRGTGELHFASADNRHQAISDQILYIVAESDISLEDIDQMYDSVQRHITSCGDRVSAIAPSRRPPVPLYACTIAALACQDEAFLDFSRSWAFASSYVNQRRNLRITSGLSDALELCVGN